MWPTSNTWATKIRKDWLLNARDGVLSSFGYVVGVTSADIAPGMDNFVFISHATKDKPLLRHLVLAFIDAGIKVWLDKPSALDFSTAEIEQYFYHLRAGGRWEDEIDEAKREASCILVCWSKRAEGAEALIRHRVLFEEAAF